MLTHQFYQLLKNHAQKGNSHSIVVIGEDIMAPVVKSWHERLCDFLFPSHQDGLSWPRWFSKKRFFEGKAFVHHACERASMRMLDEALKKKLNFNQVDFLGRQAVTIFFNEPKFPPDVHRNIAQYFTPKDGRFLDALLSAKPEVWKPRENTFDLFDSFLGQCRFLVKWGDGQLSCDTEELKHHLENFESILQVIEKHHLSLELTAEDFLRLRFQYQFQSPFLRKACFYLKEKDVLLNWLCESAHKLQVTKPHEEKIPVSATLHSFTMNPFRIAFADATPTSSELVSWWNQEILCCSELAQYFTTDSAWIAKLQSLQPVLASEMLRNKLDDSLQNKHGDKKKNKI